MTVLTDIFANLLFCCARFADCGSGFGDLDFGFSFGQILLGFVDDG